MEEIDLLPDETMMAAHVPIVKYPRDDMNKSTRSILIEA